MNTKRAMACISEIRRWLTLAAERGDRLAKPLFQRIDVRLTQPSREKSRARLQEAQPFAMTESSAALVRQARDGE